MQHKIAKRVADPIHGTIGLTAVESEIVDSCAFQRLRNVKHLGLAHLVYPGANYSRLSHSLGVCHATSLLLSSLAETRSDAFSERIVQLYRLAGLLHDVGHYPFSHAMENAGTHYYATMLKSEGRQAKIVPGRKGDPPFLSHEAVGKNVLKLDSEISNILDRHGYDPSEISAIFLREKAPLFANLIASDLDADRVDYLLRTAHHTGLPYGSIDLRYLLSQMRVDSKNRVCLTGKALRSVDHFLLCRFFDYAQVTFHKTVVALELLLKDILAGLIRENKLDVSTRKVNEMIRSKDWHSFDDSFVWQKIRAISLKSKDGLARKARALLERSPPVLLAHLERIGERKEQEARDFRNFSKIVKDRIPSWAKKFDISADCWYVWDNSGGITLTRIGAHVPLASMMGLEATALDKEKDKAEQAVLILPEGSKTATPIMSCEHSLMSVLSNHALYSLRLYCLLPERRKNKRSQLKHAVIQDCSFLR